MTDIHHLPHPSSILEFPLPLTGLLVVQALCPVVLPIPREPGPQVGMPDQDKVIALPHHESTC